MSRDARIQVLMDKEEQLQAIADAVVGYAFIQGGLSGAMYRCEKDEAAFALVPVALLDALTEEDNDA